jgi:hypothetical protein
VLCRTGDRGRNLDNGYNSVFDTTERNQKEDHKSILAARELKKYYGKIMLLHFILLPLELKDLRKIRECPGRKNWQH